MSKSSGLVRMHDELERAYARSMESFSLYYDLSLGREERAQAAGISGERKIFTSGKPRSSDVTQMGYFRAHAMTEEISMALYRSPPGKPSRRPASLDYVIAFVAKYPNIARDYTIVCTHTGVFYEESLYPQTVAIEPRGEGFHAFILERNPRQFLIDDLVISVK